MRDRNHSPSPPAPRQTRAERREAWRAAHARPATSPAPSRRESYREPQRASSGQVEHRARPAQPSRSSSQHYVVDPGVKKELSLSRAAKARGDAEIAKIHEGRAKEHARTLLNKLFGPKDG